MDSDDVPDDRGIRSSVVNAVSPNHVTVKLIGAV
jgi:hypothetical protein